MTAGVFIWDEGWNHVVKMVDQHKSKLVDFGFVHVRHSVEMELSFPISLNICWVLFSPFKVIWLMNEQ